MPSLSHFLGPPLYRRYARKTVDFPPAHCSGGQPVINAATRWLIALVVLLLTGPAWAATTVTAGTDPTKFVMKGKIVTPDQIIDGELVIEGDTITCVAVSCTDPPGAPRLTVT